MTTSSRSADRPTLDALINLLSPYEALTMIQIGETLAKAQPKIVKPASAKKTAATIDQALVSTYAESFERAAHNGPEVRKLLDALKADKRVKTGEIAAILSLIRGSDAKVSKKGDGLREIDQWYQRKRDTVRRAKDAGQLY